MLITIIIYLTSTQNIERYLKSGQQFNYRLQIMLLIADHDSELRIKVKQLIANLQQDNLCTLIIADQQQIYSLAIQQAQGSIVFFVDQNVIIERKGIQKLFATIENNYNFELILLQKSPFSLFKYFNLFPIKSDHPSPYLSNIDFIKLPSQLSLIGMKKEFLDNCDLTLLDNQFGRQFFVWSYLSNLNSVNQQISLINLQGALIFSPSRLSNKNILSSLTSLIKLTKKFKRQNIELALAFKQQLIEQLLQSLENLLWDEVYQQSKLNLIGHNIYSSYTLKKLKYLLLLLFDGKVNDFEFKGLFKSNNPLLTTFITSLLNLSPVKIEIISGDYQIIYSSQDLHDDSLVKVDLQFAQWNYGKKIIKPKSGIKGNLLYDLISNTTIIGFNKPSLSTRHKIKRGIIRFINGKRLNSPIAQIKFIFTRTLIVDVDCFTDNEVIDYVSSKLLNRSFIIYVKCLDHNNIALVSYLLRNLPVEKIIINDFRSEFLVELQRAKLCFNEQIKLIN